MLAFIDTLTCRFIALDHKQGDVYLVTVHDSSSEQSAHAWRMQKEVAVRHALQPLQPCGGRTAQRQAVCHENMPTGKRPNTHPSRQRSCCKAPAAAAAGVLVPAAQSLHPMTCCSLAEEIHDSKGAHEDQQGPRQESNRHAEVKQRTSAHSHGDACLGLTAFFPLTGACNVVLVQTSGTHVVSGNGCGTPFRLHRPRAVYMEDVQACKDALYAGESYELCLTTALSRRGACDALSLYYTLRRLSPAPYSAFLAFGTEGPQVRAPLGGHLQLPNSPFDRQ
jgi:hypothetical protein